MRSTIEENDLPEETLCKVKKHIKDFEEMVVLAREILAEAKDGEN